MKNQDAEAGNTPSARGRDYPASPLVGVGAVVYRGDEVLLIRRGNPPLYGSWSLPGGRVKEHEDLRTALIREVREECSIDIEVGDLITEFEYIERDGNHGVKYHYIVFDFKAQYAGGKLSRASDALEARWVPLDELKEFDLTNKVREVIEHGWAMR
jgi:ADP-ribose pyrophosphatase YjhB (NUDIX family)